MEVQDQRLLKAAKVVVFLCLKMDPINGSNLIMLDFFRFLPSSGKIKIIIINYIRFSVCSSNTEGPTGGFACVSPTKHCIHVSLLPTIFQNTAIF